ncbi:AraC family transcriptional regulator [Kitasatospora sp. NPDC006697]|uniref:AraC family transcriptional regulator n=1 Tax=Kitasatospora sp. NPDC006697 TaxID=3364020 RepID=UPI0036CB39A7
MLLYDGDRVESIHHMVAERFAPHRLTVLSERQHLNGRFHCLHEGQLSLYELGYGAEVQVVPGELPDFYNIQLPVSGAGLVTVDGAALPVGPWLAGPGQRLAMTWDGAARNRILILPARMVEQALRARLEESPGALPRFEPVLDERNPAVAAWLELALSFQEFVTSLLGSRSPLGLGHFERLLVDALVDAQPSSWSAPAPDHGLAVAPAALRRAVAFCEEHAHEVVSVADIAAAARVSQQSLRVAFRSHLNTTPLAFLRRVRLDLVHRDLRTVADGREGGTVTDIAIRWGFTHLGRFSAQYRQAYGELPSATLRSAL